MEEVKVVYCGKCGMPPEYCEYGPDFEAYCEPWLRKNHPEMHAKLHGGGDDAKKARPDEPWTTEERLVAFYEKYQPDKLDNVPSLLEKYAGKEEKLFTALTKKYGPEPEDPFDKESEEEDEEEEGDEGVEKGMKKLEVSGNKKRRGAKAKKGGVVETRVVIQKIARQKKRVTTVVVGMETIPGLKLKDVSKAFSKRFAGSSSVKDGPKGKEIMLQGDHMEEVAEMIVTKYGAPASAVFLDMDGEFVAFA
eukprot:CAMPEP_0198122568 /NCGR_PEP_ID=MMETSP1442-20131203/35219_1 /TAXON_ID= /ORGANISM="Craspedostauros australis, Strain CCMP3328" /LENGTH=248 /DNA_ID=CAMNT_0043781627 /DNA_START=65 /DNA_END=811 /DNA_ORIENTATION=+